MVEISARDARGNQELNIILTVITYELTNAKSKYARTRSELGLL